VSEGGIAAGVRRIEAITGEAALAWVDQNDALLKEVAGMLRGTREELRDKVRDTLDRMRQMEKELRTLKDKLASGSGTDLASGAVDVHGIKVVATKIEGADAGALRNAVDQLKSRLKSAVVVLASVEGPSKITLVAGVTADLVARIKAGDIVGSVAAKVGGRGGGRPDFAQAGGSDVGALDAALASVAEAVRSKIAA
jgi:alanyl-tRNA synthetase